MAAQGMSAGVLVMIACFLSVSGEEVPDGVVYTDLHKTVERGNEIILKCRFHKDPVGVYWMKEDDPDQSYNLISWVEGTFLSGSCLSTERCELDENDYSLVIRDAQIADRGRYICRISNYLGILIHNYTDVEIIAPPSKPYPVIKQCVEAEPNGVNSTDMCVISSDNPISITCMAMGFFPDLELFFLHGSKRITTIDSNEWTNDDGAKSKSISVSGSPSEAPYVCVASFIPGRSDQETATVLINLLPDPASGSREPPDPAAHTPKVNENTPSDNRIAKIAVPVSLFVVAGIGILLVYLWRRHRNGGDEPEANDIEAAEPMLEINRINVPGHPNEPPNSQEVKVLVRKLTSRHWKQLANHVGIRDENTISRIHDENRGMLFDTESMINEWIEEKKCSPEDVLHKIGGLDMSVHKTDFMRQEFNDAELERIATYLSSSQLKELFGDGDDPADLVRAFVEDSMAKNPKQNYRDKLRNELQTIGCAGLVPYKVKSKVYLCELLDVAFRLLLEDVYPIAKSLGISGERLKKYRIDYTPDQLTKGTIAALVKFSKDKSHDRRKVCEALSSGGYQNIALLLEYGHEVSLADEFAVVSKAGDNEEFLPNISRNLETSERNNIETLLRDWKAMVHPPSYNHRTSLADAVRSILGVDVAAAILSGQYREHGSESSEVIKRIINVIESFEESLIAKILGVDDLKKLPQQEVITDSHSIDQTDENRDFNSDGEMGEVAFDVSRASKSALALTLAEILSVTVEQPSPAQYTSITQVLETWVTKLRENRLRKDDRRELSNNLLKTGFKEFAFEIMTGFVPGPADNTSNLGGDDGEDKVAGNSNEQVGEDNRRETKNDNGEQVSEEQAQQ